MTERKIKRVFVTGASGFIGSALIKYLSQLNMEVYCLIHNTVMEQKGENIKLIQGDIFDFNWMLLDEIKPDVIFHFARATGRSKSERKFAAQKNAAANQRLLSWLERLVNPPLLVFGSGTLVYGNRGNEWVNEGSVTDPISFQREYFKAEEPVLDHINAMSSPVIVVRPPWIYGNGSWFKWFYWQHMENKKSIPLYGKGLNQMSLIHIDDCAGMIFFAAKHGDPGTIYNITGHPPMSQLAFAGHIQELIKLPIQKYSAPILRLKLGKAAVEALTFSLKSNSSHELMLNYDLRYPELKSGLQSLVEQFHQVH